MMHDQLVTHTCNLPQQSMTVVLNRGGSIDQEDSQEVKPAAVYISISKYRSRPIASTVLLIIESTFIIPMSYPQCPYPHIIVCTILYSFIVDFRVLCPFILVPRRSWVVRSDICSHQLAASPPFSAAGPPDLMIATQIIHVFSYSTNILFCFSRILISSDRTSLYISQLGWTPPSEMLFHNH